VGTTLAGSPAVRLTQHGDVPIPDAQVVFAIVLGAGSADGQTLRTVRTDPDGRARVRWTLGTAAGTNLLRVTAPGATNTVEFRTDGKAGPLARILPAVVPTTARVGAWIGPVVVQTTDQYGNPVAGVTVTFSLGPEGGALSTPTNVVSGANGLAALSRWTLGTRAGPYTLKAAADGVEPLVMTATALPGPAARMEIIEGDQQRAIVMTRVAVPPAVRITDVYGNGVMDRLEVWFRPEAQHDTYVSGPAQWTDRNGEARAPWILGRRPVDYVLHVTAGGLTATFTAAADPGPPGRLLISAGDRQTGPANTPLPIRPAVQVADVWGNPLAAAGIAVTFTPFGNSGTIRDGVVTTDAGGIATAGAWTLGPTTIPYGNLLVVTSPGLWQNSFLATGE
jgi:hypothetical protein